MNVLFSMVALSGFLLGSQAYAAGSTYEEAVDALRAHGLSSTMLTGRNYFGRECSANFQEGAKASVTGLPESLRFHVSVDELDEAEDPALATLGFALWDTAKVTSILSSASELRIEANQMKPTPPHGALRKTAYSIRVVDDAVRQAREVQLSEDGRLSVCIIR